MARIDGTAACQFTIDLVNIQQSIVEEGVENFGKRTPIESDGDGLPWQEYIGLPRVSSRET